MERITVSVVWLADRRRLNESSVGKQKLSRLDFDAESKSPPIAAESSVRSHP